MGSLAEGHATPESSPGIRLELTEHERDLLLELMSEKIKADLVHPIYVWSSTLGKLQGREPKPQPKLKQRDSNASRPIEELEAGDTFRIGLVPRADAYSGPYPLWHGWAILDAFLARIDYARLAPLK